MNDQKTLPYFFYPTKNSTERSRLAKLKREKRIRSIGPRLYTSLPEKEAAAAVRSNWAEIVSKLFPAALLSHRSAVEYSPTNKGEVFLTSGTNRDIRYPGLNLRFKRGPKALPSDVDFLEMKASSLARALLECLSIAKGNGKDWLLPIEAVEKKLDSILSREGEARLSRLRDEARETSRKLGWKKEFKKLDGLIGALLGTRSARGLKTDGAKARAAGRPYDLDCFRRLDALFSDLQRGQFHEIREVSDAPSHLKNKAFFEAYFSNYIEGTVFEISEAEEIVFEKKVPAKRPKDAHDVLGTYQIVSDRREMKKTPETAGDLFSLLKARHGKLLGARPEVEPGQFKSKPNRAGGSFFVKPEYVEGTLEKGFSLYALLPEGFRRAVFVMFMVAEVHPFADGNGRIARIMMNSELVSQDLSTIIVPTVYREDYLLALRALTRRERAQPVIQMLEQAYSFSQLDFTHYPTVLKLLEKRNWFLDPDDGKIVF